MIVRMLAFVASFFTIEAFSARLHFKSAAVLISAYVPTIVVGNRVIQGLASADFLDGTPVH
jgi:hypothetical protein